MSEINFQKDFFEGEVYDKKGRKTSLLNRYSGQRLLPHVRIPVEYAVISVIAVLVIIIISYAFGVEKGKKIASVKTAEMTAEVFSEEPEMSSGRENPDFSDGENISDNLMGIEPVPEMEEIDIPVNQDAESMELRSGISEPGKTESVYIVQLASFRNEDSAMDEISRLKIEGIRGEMSKTGEWFQVYAAGYQTIDEARKAKRFLDDRYQDCYIRKVK